MYRCRLKAFCPPSTAAMFIFRISEVLTRSLIGTSAWRHVQPSEWGGMSGMSSVSKLLNFIIEFCTFIAGFLCYYFRNLVLPRFIFDCRYFNSESTSVWNRLESFEFVDGPRKPWFFRKIRPQPWIEQTSRYAQPTSKCAHRICSCCGKLNTFGNNI